MKIILICLIAFELFAFTNKNIVVYEPSGIDRNNEIVTFGIPISRGDQLLNTNTLALYDESNVKIDAQFLVTARWNAEVSDTTAYIRWLLVTAQFNISANDSLMYAIKNNGNGSVQNGISCTLTGSSPNQILTVSTGTATFQLMENGFNLFNKVIVGETVVVDSAESDGIVIVDSSSGNNSSEGGLSFSDNQGTYYSSSSDIINFRIDSVHSGALQTIVEVRYDDDNNNGDDHLESVCRFHFFKNKSYVKVSYSFIERELTDHLDRYDIDLIRLNTNINFVHNPTVVYGDDKDSTGTHSIELTGGDSLVLYQTGTIEQSLSGYNPGNSSSLTYTISGAYSDDGKKARGWVKSGDDSVGLMVSIQDFWQMYPKRLVCDFDGDVHIDLWPSEAEDMTVYSGAQRTHNLLYYFYSGTINNEDSLHIMFNDPILVLPDIDDLSQSFALGVVNSFDTTKYDANYQTAIDSLQGRINYCADFIYSARDNDSRAGNIHSYGMWQFGNGVPNDGAWGANDYDAVRGYLLAAVSNVKYQYKFKWLDIAKMTGQQTYDCLIKHSYTNHRDDIGSNDTPITRNDNSVRKKYLGDPAYNPCDVFFEMGTDGYIAINQHHAAGIQGLAYLYYLTGDLMAREVAIDQGYWMRTYRQLWSSSLDYQARTYGALLSMALGLYELRGTSDDLDDVNFWYNLAASYQDNTESSDDPNGMIWTDGDETTVTVSFMNSIALIALVDYAAQFPDSTDASFRIRNATEWQYENLWDSSNNRYYRSMDQPGEYFYNYSPSAGIGYAWITETNETKKTNYYNQYLADIRAGYVNQSITKEKDVQAILRGLYGSLYYLQSDAILPGYVLQTSASQKKTDVSSVTEDSN